MKKGLFYYCLAFSLALHVLFSLVMRLEQPAKKEKEPVIVDLIGTPKLGPKTMLPVAPKKSRMPRPVAAEPKPHAQKQTIPSSLQSLRALLPSFPSPPQGRNESKPAQPPSPPPMPGEVPQGASRQATPKFSGEAGKGPSAPSSPSPGSNGVEGTPRRLIRPSEEDLERYAKLDKETEKSKADSITLDTEDLMSTAYMHSLKTRIEMIWKYPETARRDGLEGNLVMQFTIAKSGKISGIELLKSSGYPMLDEAAKQALLDASPYNPLPQSWKKDSFTITGTFIYTLYGGLSRGFNLDDIE